MCTERCWFRNVSKSAFKEVSIRAWNPPTSLLTRKRSHSWLASSGGLARDVDIVL